jgi:hypothetical protein
MRLVGFRFLLVKGTQVGATAALGGGAGEWNQYRYNAGSISIYVCIGGSPKNDHTLLLVGPVFPRAAKCLSSSSSFLVLEHGRRRVARTNLVRSMVGSVPALDEKVL